MTDRYFSPTRGLFRRPAQTRYLLRAAIWCAPPGPIRDALIGMAPPKVEEWKALETIMHHDIAAWIRLVRDQLPPELADSFHRGLTSSDLVDTALHFALEDAQDMISRSFDGAATLMATFALIYRDAPIRGRTHGQAAEYTSIGRRVALDLLRLDRAYPTMTPQSLKHASGPVGVTGHAEMPSTQIAPRDGLSRAMGHLIELSLAIEQAALNVRLAARWPERAVWIERTGDYAGSSSMPDKNNPTSAERLCGLAGVIRANARAVQDSSVVWEERDISHSSVERTSMVEAIALTDYCLRELGTLFGCLRATKEADVALTAVPAIEMLLDSGMAHEEAYKLVQARGPVGATQSRGVEAAPRPYDPGRERERQLWVVVQSRLQA